MKRERRKRITKQQAADKYAKFALGSIILTAAAREILTDSKGLMTQQALDLLTRHHTGDWGDGDKQKNYTALATGGELLSSYTVNGNGILIFTNDKRTETTILRASEA